MNIENDVQFEPRHSNLADKNRKCKLSTHLDLEEQLRFKVTIDRRILDSANARTFFFGISALHVFPEAS